MTSQYTANDIEATIPALGDSANIVTAFEDYHNDVSAAVAVLARTTNTFTGAISVGTTLAVTGNTTLTGDLAVNGGDFTTSASTFNLLASPLTVNIAAAGTSVTIGATTGQTAVRNDLVIGTGKTVIFEGATNNDFETILTVVDPTSSDKTITLPNATGYAALTSSTTGIITLGTDTAGNYVAGITAGDGIGVSGSGSEGASPTVSLSHLGIQSLSDPGADRILFWDDSATATAWLTVSTGLSLSGTTLTNSGVTSITGTADEITASASTGGVTLSLPSTINANTTGTAAKATSLAGGVAGSVPYQSGTGTTAYTAAGTPGQFLTSNGTSAPTWTTYSDTYPTSMIYSGGTSAGPVATITGTNFLSFAASAIPSAATDASGIVTNQAQSFGGKKTFGNGIAIENGGAFEYYGYSTTAGTSTLTNVPGTVSYATNQPSILTSVLTANAATNTGSVGAEFRASGTTTTHLITFSSGTTARGSISTNSTTTTYSTSSDYRLKENIHPIVNATDRLMLLKPSRFNFIEFPDKVVDGFIAHEAQEVVPESVVGNKDDVNEDGSPAYQGIDQSKLVPLLTAALQESIAKIEELTSRIEALEA
jgi:hypothetical protein